MQDNLSQYGHTFQTKVISSLISDKIFLQQVFDIIDPSYFESQANSWIVGKIISYYEKYEIIFLNNNNNKFIRITIKEKKYDETTTIKNILWVKNKKEMLRKVKNWSHKNDRNWEDLIEEEFSRDFNGKDFVHNYSYEIVENKFKI